APGRRPKALLLWGANPAFSGPDPAAMARALAEIPFVVSFSSVLDESTLQADLVLPDHVFLEAWNEVPPSPSLPRMVVGMAQPALKPLHDTRHSADVVLDLARRLGGGVAAALPWKDHDEVLQTRARALQAAQGSLFGEKEGEGGAAGAAQSLEDFRDGLAKKGGWQGAPYSFGEWSRVLRTRSGKLELYSLTLRDALAAAPAVPGLRQALGLSAGDDRVYLPHFAARAEIGDPAAFPLRLFTFSTLALGDGASADQPYLQEIVAPHLNVAWDAWVELHPSTAARLGISDGDRVWVESPVGRARVRAKLYQGVGPEVAAVVLGQGHSALGRYARDKGGNAALLLPGAPHPLTGAPLYLTRVKVYAA
ncbi:MAG TPA: molybdopterin dinucleotide binding domain-containing protein, partial [Longimicrobiales bacterium]